MNRVTPLVLLLACVMGCHQDGPLNADSGYDYFPVKVGTYWEYFVEETSYSLSQAPSTHNYQLKETVSARYTDATGQNVYQIERAIKTGNGNWQSDSTHMVWKSTDRAFKLENGLIEVKLRFPIAKGLRWNRHEYNVLPETLSEITEMDETKQIGNSSYPSTLTVVLQNDSTLLSSRQESEVYAKGIGLIRQEVRYLNYCSPSECEDDTRITFGYIQSKTLISHSE